MLSADYCKAARPEPPRCIGIQLRPYSFGHHVSLRAYDSTFLTGRIPVFSDLILGVFICSQTWAGWQEWKSSWKFPVFLKLWGWMAGKFDVPKEAERFAQYIKEGETCPELIIPDKARALTAAWEARLKLFLIRQLGISSEAVMDYPLALAWQEYCAYGEQEDHLTLLSESDKKSLEFIGSDRHKELVREAEEAAKKEDEARRN